MLRIKEQVKQCHKGTVEYSTSQVTLFYQNKAKKGKNEKNRKIEDLKNKTYFRNTSASTP